MSWTPTTAGSHWIEDTERAAGQPGEHDEEGTAGCGTDDAADQHSAEIERLELRLRDAERGYGGLPQQRVEPGADRRRVARTRALPPDKLEAWTAHHIEEVGNLENFLPALFRAETR